MIKKCIIAMMLASIVMTGFCNISTLVKDKIPFGFASTPPKIIAAYADQFKANFPGFTGCHFELIAGRANAKDIKNWQLVCALGGLIHGYFRFIPYYKVAQGVEKATAHD